MIDMIPIAIGGVVGMTIWVGINMANLKFKGKQRCNCRNKIMRIKRNEKRFNDSLG